MPLSIGNVSYVLIYLAELKVKGGKTVATLSPLAQLRHVVVSASLVSVSHSTAPPAQGRWPTPSLLTAWGCLPVPLPLLLLLLTLAHLEFNRERGHHFCTQRWHTASSELWLQHFDGFPSVPIPFRVIALYYRVAILRKLLEITRYNIIVELG